MKATELIELLQKYPEATVMHLMPYRMDDETVAAVHSPIYIPKGGHIHLSCYIDDYDVQYCDDAGNALMDLIILL